MTYLLMLHKISISTSDSTSFLEVMKTSKLAFRLKMPSGVLQLEQMTIEAVVLLRKLRSWVFDEDAVFWLEVKSSSSLDTLAAAPITIKASIKLTS